MEILGHEMAHAIAGGGSQEHEVDRAGRAGRAASTGGGPAVGRQGPQQKLSMRGMLVVLVDCDAAITPVRPAVVMVVVPVRLVS